MIGVNSDVTGVVLAGGQGRRMGGSDKGLVTIDCAPMIQYVLQRLAPQVNSILINANRNQNTYARFGLPVISDTISGFAGPLAGMATALEKAKTRWVLTVPCDSPLLPNDLVQRMYSQVTDAGAEIGVADDGQRMHPVFTLLQRDLLPSILAFLERGERKIDRWFAEHHTCIVDFSDCAEAFLNVNRLEDKTMIEDRLKT